MSTIKSSAEHLTLNADGSGNDIKFQSNGTEVASISDGGVLSSTGGSTHADNVKAKFGTGDDLQIWHDGTHTRLQNTTGNFNIRADVFNVTKSDDSEDVIVANADGDIKLYRNNVIHLETLATGVRVPVGGVLFGTDTAADNALDDYEEGTWNPTLTCTTSGSYTLDSSANTLAYTKIGRTVHIQGGISITGRNSENGNIKMSLPFTPMTGTDDSDYCEGDASLYNHGGSKPNGIKIFVFGAAEAYFRTIPDNGVGFYLDHGDTDASFEMRFSFTYVTSA